MSQLKLIKNNCLKSHLFRTITYYHDDQMSIKEVIITKNNKSGHNIQRKLKFGPPLLVPDINFSSHQSSLMGND